MDPVQMVCAVVGLVIVVIGPGSGLYIAHRRALNGVAKSIVAIEADMSGVKTRLDAVHVALIRALERQEVHEEEITRLRDRIEER